jgi:predicted transcriptional regulator
MNDDKISVPKVHDREYRFCLILWAHEPVSSKELVALCREQLGWKPTTTYTVIKRLAERGILQNDNAIVTSLVSKQAVQAYEIQKLIRNRFDGSINDFLSMVISFRNI